MTASASAIASASVSRPLLAAGKPHHEPNLPATNHYPLQDAPVSQLSTSKVWVLPPRPKPGRKPSTDTPPTKRKAQNRAAQRAFRERRAARVSELEEMLAEINAERDKRERELSKTLKTMAQENLELRKTMDELKNEMKSVYNSRRASVMTNSEPAKQVSRYPSMNQMISPTPSMDSPMHVLDRALELRLPVNTDVKTSNEDDCGVCAKDDCICETLGIKELKHQQVSARPQFHIPEYTSEAVPLKRQRSGVTKMNPFKKLKNLKESTEIDFTASFSKVLSPPTKRQSTSYSKVSPIDRCGFCADGTPCLCIDSFNIQDSFKTLAPLNIYHTSSPNTSRRTSRLPSLTSVEYQGLGSPISIVPVDQQYMGSSIDKTNGECTGNPGTCSQCQADPMSTLFCTTLASRVYASTTVKSSRHSITSLDKENKSEGKCGKAGGSSTEQNPLAVKQSPKDSLMIQLPPGTPSTTTPSGTFIPCSAAYQALSRHKQFKKVDLNQIVGKLKTRGMQVEVGSVVEILRELDKSLKA